MIGDKGYSNTMKNLGLVWIPRSDQHSFAPWKLEVVNDEVKIDEFSSQTYEIVAFLFGYCAALGLEDSCFDVQGDYFHERTHVVFVSGAFSGWKALIRSIKLWLSAPRRRLWRVLLIDAKADKPIAVVYASGEILNPQLEVFPQ